MKEDWIFRSIYYPMIAVMAAVRKPVFWLVVLLGMAIWWYDHQNGEVVELEGESLMEEVLHEAPMAATAQGPVPLSLIPAMAAGNGTSRLEEFTLPPDFTEAMVGRYRLKEGRSPRNWEDFVSAGVAAHLPSAPEGFQYVYDPELGLLEMLRVNRVKP